MSSGVRRAVIAVAGVAILVVAFVVLNGGDSSSTGSGSGDTSTPTVRVVDAKPQGGVQKLSFKQGGTVKFTVVSDTADEIHVHGYDVHKDVAKGGSVHFRFPASIEGKFIVELENHKQTLANVTVAP